MFSVFININLNNKVIWSHDPSVSLSSTLQLAQILPTEENFLLCFREFVGSSTEFMAVSLYLFRCFSPYLCLMTCTALYNSILSARSSFIMYSLMIVKNSSCLPSFCWSFRVKAPQWWNDKLHWAVKFPHKMPEDSSAITVWPLGHMLSCSVIPFVFLPS